MTPLPPQLRPWRRGPFLVLAILFVLALLGWVLAAVAVLAGSDEPPLGVLCPFIASGIVLVLLALPLLLARRRARRTTSASLLANEDGATLLRRGDYAEARRIFEDLCLESRWAPALHTLYANNYGVACLHAGDVEQAIRSMEQARATGWFEGPLAAHRAHAQIVLALAYAVAGDVARATSLRDTAVRVLSPVRRSATWLLDAVLAARRGEALPLDGDALREAESTLMPPHVRALALLQRFTATRAGSAYRGPAVVLDADEHGWLAQKWPELRSFLDRLQAPPS